MARYSQTLKGIKLEEGDIVRNFLGVRGKVETVEIIRPKNLPVDVLLLVDYSRGTGNVNVVHLAEVEAVSVKGKWFDMKGDALA